MLNNDGWNLLVSEQSVCACRARGVSWRPKIHMLVASVTVCKTRVPYKSALWGGYVRHRSESSGPQRLNCHAELFYFKRNDMTSSVQLWNLQKTNSRETVRQLTVHRETISDTSTVVLHVFVTIQLKIWRYSCCSISPSLTCKTFWFLIFPQTWH